MTDRRFFRPAWFLAILLAVGAALFAIGVSVERNNGDHHSEATATSAVTATTVHNEASESGGEGGTETGSEGGTVASSESTVNGEGTSTEASEHSESSEKVLGINTESTGLVVVAVALSGALAILVLVRPRRRVFLAVASFAVLFAAFDILELIHQINNSRAGIATIAAAVLLIHAAAALLSAQGRTPDALGESRSS